MSILLLAGITGVCLVISVIMSRERTWKSVKSAFAIAKGIMPDVLGILLIVSVLLAIINKDLIAATLGNENALVSTGIGALIGSVTIIPGVMAFPLSKELLASGASLVALASFITTLTMVGIATAPIEKRFFGARFTVVRNLLSFLLAMVIALLMGVIL